MKGFLGVALAAAPTFLASIDAGRLDAPVHYALSYDEEVGCIGVRGLLADLQAIGLAAAGCIVGEPTSMQPIVAHKGTHRFRCRVHGREAHSSYTTHGVNAIEYAAKLIVFVRDLADRLAATEVRDYGFNVPYSTLSTGVIRGGIAANVIPRHLRRAVRHAHAAERVVRRAVRRDRRAGARSSRRRCSARTRAAASS